MGVNIVELIYHVAVKSEVYDTVAMNTAIWDQNVGN